MRKSKLLCRMTTIIALLFCVLSWQAAFSSSDTSEPIVASTVAGQPFAPGEKLTFQLRWGLIPAGETVLEVYPMAEIDGRQAYHFVMTATTNSFVDLFYKVRDRIDAFTDAEMTHSVFYKKKQQEGSTRRNVEVKFDWQRQEAFYSNFGREEKSISLMPGTFDPLSVFYYIRSLELKEIGEVERPVTDGKKSVVGRARIIKRETIMVADASYDTYLLEPELKHIGGVFEKSKDAKIMIWVSADERRLPVKVKSKVVVGSFVAELSGVEKSSQM